MRDVREVLVVSEKVITLRIGLDELTLSQEEAQRVVKHLNIVLVNGWPDSYGMAGAPSQPVPGEEA